MDEELSEEAMLEEKDIVEEVNVEEEDTVEEEARLTESQSIEIVEPKVGMLFPDANAVYNFWKTYGTQKGFPVRKRSSKKRNGKLAYVNYMCSLGGKFQRPSNNPFRLQAHTRLGCPVKLTAGLGTDGQWCITVLFLRHNHALSPTKSRYFRCNRFISENVKRRLELNDRADIRVNNNSNACIEEIGGYENTTLVKYARNHIDKARHLRLGEGDAMAIQQYFLKMQAQSPGFFFIMDLNEEDGRLRNVFWADARSREAYKEFGRVITFDTTYLTNEYDMPFTSFVGVNHHGQSVLLGCGLISAQDKDTFVWLFQTWLTCMSGVAPEGIITDQDRAMQNAIEIVFPNTRHRWCLWHITRKIPEKLGGYKKNASIISDMFNSIYDSQIPIEFEQTWNAMLDMYSLHENSWLSGLYDQRHRWIPCFVKSSFWAGMSTTQRNESLTAYFDEYVNSKTTLKQFVEQYGKALRNKVEKESEADYRSFSQRIPLATHYEMEKQFQVVYTLSKFKEFQKELLSKLYCDIVSKNEDVMGLEWVIEEDTIVGKGKPKRVNFTVSMNQDDVRCSCQLFEFRGILCRHAMYAFLKVCGNVKLPEKYIFKLWRKDVRRCHSRVKITYDGYTTTDEQKRYDTLCAVFTKVADLASVDENKYQELLGFLESLKDHLSSNASNLVRNISTPTSVEPISSYVKPSSGTESQDILDPIRRVSNNFNYIGQQLHEQAGAGAGAGGRGQGLAAAWPSNSIGRQ